MDLATERERRVGRENENELGGGEGHGLIY